MHEQENKQIDAAAIREPRYLTERRATSRRQADSFHTIESAAETLAMAPAALRARCRRAAIREGRDVVAYLGGGIVAYKLGRSWRVKFPPSP